MPIIKFYILLFISTLRFYLNKFSNQNINKIFNTNFSKQPYKGYRIDYIDPWIDREKLVNDEEPQRVEHEATKEELRRAQMYVLLNIKYEKEEVNYWKTSYETFNDGYGDCEDQAFAIYKTLRNMGIYKDRLGIVLIKGHAFACYYFSDNDFYIIDNGYVTLNIAKASEVFPVYRSNEYKEPIIGFNLEEKWNYV